MNTKKWTTKEGVKIRIKDMTDGHLVNTIRMLERVHASNIEMAMWEYATVQGEMAQYYMEQAIDEMFKESCDHPLYGDMVEEAEKRKLDW